MFQINSKRGTHLRTSPTHADIATDAKAQEELYMYEV